MAAAHASLAAYLKFKDTPEVAEWLAGPFYKAVCRVTDEEFARLMQLNANYVEKFDFPFILAVRGHTPDSILASMESRLRNDAPSERRTALTQIGLIGGYRLEDVVEP